MSLRDELHLDHNHPPQEVYLVRNALTGSRTARDVPSRSDAKDHAVVDHTADDTLIDHYITTAKRFAERVTGHYVDEHTRVVAWDGFTERIRIPARPVQSLDVVEKVEDDSVTSLTLSNFYIEDGPAPHVVRKDGVSEPTYPLDRFRVEVTVGYSADADVPADYDTALRQMVADLYEGRTSVAWDASTDSMDDMPLTWETLLRPLQLPPNI